MSQRPWVAFTDLRPGDRFKFEKHPDIYTKWRGGWYRDSAGRRFRTGKWTAVVPVSWAMTPPSREQETTAA